MTRLTHTQLAVAAGFEILPSILLVALGHPRLGAAALGAALVLSTVQTWMLIRSERDWQRTILSYAQDNIYMGRDPNSVIAALHAAAAGELLEPQQRKHDHRQPRGEQTR